MAKKISISRARRLRKNSTTTEQILWKELRHRKLNNFKFRRQRPIGPYIVDFFCVKAKLVVEIDGSSHIGKEAYDQRRESFLRGCGFTVLKFWDTEVYEDLEGVLETIERYCRQLSS